MTGVYNTKTKTLTMSDNTKTYTISIDDTIENGWATIDYDVDIQLLIDPSDNVMYLYKYISIDDELIRRSKTPVPLEITA